MTEMLLHRAEVAAGTLEELDRARMAKRMRVDGVDADALAKPVDAELLAQGEVLQASWRWLSTMNARVEARGAD